MYAVVSASNQCLGQSQQTKHLFASAAITENRGFSTLPEIAPKESLMQIQGDFFLPQHWDWNVIRNEYKCAYLQRAYKILEKIQSIGKITYRETEASTSWHTHST